MPSVRGLGRGGQGGGFLWKAIVGGGAFASYKKTWENDSLQGRVRKRGKNNSKPTRKAISVNGGLPLKTTERTNGIANKD